MKKSQSKSIPYRKQEITIHRTYIEIDEDNKKQTALNGAFSIKTLTYKQEVTDSVQDKTFFTIWIDMNVSPAYVIYNDWLKRGWYISSYRIKVEPVVNDSNVNLMCLASSPPNNNRSTTVSVSTSSSAGLDIGFFGGTPTGGINYSESTGISRSYAVDDMEVVNESQKDHVAWKMSMPDARKVTKDSFLGTVDIQAVTELKNLQLHTFQPSFVGEWCIDEFPDSRLEVKITLEVIFAITAVAPELSWDVSYLLPFKDFQIEQLKRPLWHSTQKKSQEFSVFLHSE